MVQKGGFGDSLAMAGWFFKFRLQKCVSGERSKKRQRAETGTLGSMILESFYPLRRIRLKGRHGKTLRETKTSENKPKPKHAKPLQENHSKELLHQTQTNKNRCTSAAPTSFPPHCHLRGPNCFLQGFPHVLSAFQASWFLF